MKNQNSIVDRIKSYFLLVVLALSLTGCASLNPKVEVFSSDMSTDIDNYAKSFPIPPSGYSGLYVIRKNKAFGQALKKSLYLMDNT